VLSGETVPRDKSDFDGVRDGHEKLLTLRADKASGEQVARRFCCLEIGDASKNLPADFVAEVAEALILLLAEFAELARLEGQYHFTWPLAGARHDFHLGGVDYLGSGGACVAWTNPLRGGSLVVKRCLPEGAAADQG